jgi:hypothetical protein
MKKLLCICAVMLMAFTAAPALAANITGTWTGDMKGPDGNRFQLTFTFKQDGAKLTGTVLGPQGDPIAITDGKVDGDKISFTVNVNGMIITHEGTISGAEIKLTSKSDQGPAGEMTLKRSEEPPPATK